jgi:hypothetical protein
VYDAYAQHERQADQEDGKPEGEHDDRYLRECSDTLQQRGEPSVVMNSGVVSHAENNPKVRAILPAMSTPK